MTRLFGLLLLFAICMMAGRAEAKPDIYYLAVGSSRYLHPTDEDDHGFQRLDGARNGAVALSDRFSAGGARYGISLTSPEGSVIGLADFNKALDDLLARVASDKGAEPILIVYIAAHGISDGFAWNHFSVPGDLTYRGKPDKLSPARLGEQAIYAADIAFRLKSARLHYLLILDTCYEGTPSVFQSPVLSQSASNSIVSIAQALRFANEFHQADPVLFSTAPGTTVLVAPDPTDPASNSMGPLARRLVMMIDARVEKQAPLSVADIVLGLRSAPTDPVTRPAVSNAAPASWWKSVVVAPGVKPGEVDERVGTATAPRLCCMADLPSPMVESVAVDGVITLFGGPSEFVTGGQTIVLNKGITLERPDVSTITLNVPDAGGDWQLEFVVQGAVHPGMHRGAERAGFQSGGHPGLSISGHAHGCNEIRGQFEIMSLPSKVAGKLKLHLTQFCDDIAAPLTGEIDVSVR